MDPLDQLSDEELALQAFNKNPIAAMQAFKSMPADYMDSFSDQTLTKFASFAQNNRELKQAQASQEKGNPLPADTKSLDLYTNDEPSFLDSLSSAAGSFSAGFEAIPSKLKYDINTTIDGIANSIGLMDDATYSKNIADYKRALGSSIDQNNPDVKRFPGIAQNTQDIGALAAETAATGLAGAPATASRGAIPSLFNAASTGATQGAALGLLQGDPGNKQSAAGVGALLGGTLAAGSELASQGITKLIAPSISRAGLEEQVTASQAAGAETGVRPTGSQLFGSINPRYEQAMSTIQKQVSPYVDDITAIEKGSSLQTKANVINAFSEAEKAARKTSDNLYADFLQNVDDQVGTMKPQATQDAARAIRNTIEQGPGRFGGYAKNSELVDFLNRADKMDNVSPSDLYHMRLDVDSTISSLSKQLDMRTADRAMLSELKNLRSALDEDVRFASQATPETAAQYEGAMQYWKDNVLALRNAGIQTSKGVSQYEALLKFIKDPTKSDKAQAVLQAMGPEGIQSIKTSLATEAVERALDKQGNVNITNFVGEYNRAVKEYGMVMGDVDTHLVDGLSKLIQGGQIQRQTKPWLPDTLSRIWKAAQDNPTFQNIVLTLGRLPSGSKKADKILNGFYSMAGNLMRAETTTQTSQQSNY